MVDEKMTHRFAHMILFVFLALAGGAYLWPTLNPAWIVEGDSINGFIWFTQQVAGFERGEYPIWNPLVRAGEREPTFQIFFLANPIFNLSAFSTAVLGVTNMVTAYVTTMGVFALFYILGCAALVELLTKDRIAGIFAGLIAAGSSPVIFINYHFEFILILHALPWILVGMIGFFKFGEAKYVGVTVLAGGSFVYAYEFVMGLLFLVLLGGAFFFLALLTRRADSHPWFNRATAGLWRRASAFVPVGLIFIAPLMLFFFEFTSQVPISRITDLTVTETYTVAFENHGYRRYIDYFLHPKFWITAFSNGIFSSIDEMRSMIGALAAVPIGVALFSSRTRRVALIFTIAGLGVMATHFPVLRQIYDVFPFRIIGNVHFMYEFAFFAMTVVAGLGFAVLRHDPRATGFKWLSLAFAAFLAIWFGAQFLFTPWDRLHNLVILAAGLAVTLGAVWTRERVESQRWAHGMLVATASYTLLSLLLFSRQQFPQAPLPGPYPYRELADSSLLFKERRPHEIEFLDMPETMWRKNAYYSQTHEFSSFLTRRDNSWKSTRGVQMASFPLEEAYVLLTAMPGHDALFEKKFHLFSEVATLCERADMIAFRHHPDLLANMVRAGVAVVDCHAPRPEVMKEAPPFKPDAVSLTGRQPPFTATVAQYMSNSLEVDVLTEKAGLFVYTDLWAPGWSVTVDGASAPLQKVFDTVKGVYLDAGHHTVRFSYTSPAHWAVMILQAAYWIVFAGSAVMFLRQKKALMKPITPASRPPRP